MLLSSAELAAAKDATGLLLDELGIETYVYEVEPQDGTWKIKVDCATTTGWQSLSMMVDKQALLASRTNPAVRSNLLETFRRRLAT